MLKSLCLLCVLFTAFTRQVFADSPLISRAYGSGGGPSKFGFRLMGGMKFQHGTIGSKDNETVKGRKMNAVGAEALAGINWGPVIVGIGSEYSKWFQSTDPKDVGDTNLSGSVVNFSGAAGIALGKLCLIGKYHYKSTFTLDQKSVAGEKVEYTTPAGSYTATLMYRPGGRSFWSLDYTNISYEKEKRAGATNKLDSNTTMNLTAIGLSYGFMF